nr:hypothetical protein PanWU01x14_136540 [Ipomoea batatas]
MELTATVSPSWILNIEASRSAKEFATKPRNSNSTLIVSAKIDDVDAVFVSEGFEDGLIGGEMGEFEGFGEVGSNLSHGSGLRNGEETDLFHQSLRQFHVLLLNRLGAGHQGGGGAELHVGGGGGSGGSRPESLARRLRIGGFAWNRGEI